MAEPTSTGRILERIDAVADAGERREAIVLERVGALAADVAEVKGEVAGVRRTVSLVVADQGRAVERMNRIERAQEPVDEAMQSHHSIELGFRDDLHRIEQVMLLRLEQQDATAKAIADKTKAEADAREAVKAEERRQESIAARRLEADRTHREKMTAARTPAIVAVIGFLGIVASGYSAYYAAKAAHVDTNAKVDNTSAKVDRLSTQVTAALSSEPTTAPSSPPAAATKK